jgi:pyruvate ferredoxin oxidoreductase gamma subunit
LEEIRIHGRGGQGSVVMAQMIAEAAFEGGKYPLAFPFIGSGERRGAPIQSYVRISDEPVRLREKIINPDFIILQDATIIETVDVFDGIRPNGLVLINSDRDSEAFREFVAKEVKIFTVDANKISLEIFGKPITNSPMLGAFAAITGLIPLEAVTKAINKKFKADIAEKNVEAVIKAFQLCGGEA